MINKFTFKRLLYKCDPVLDGIFKEALKSGIKSVKSNTEHNSTAYFNNGTEIYFWNANKYYGWMASGCCKFPDEYKYYWNNSRPSRKTMSDFYNQLNNVFLNKNPSE